MKQSIESLKARIRSRGRSPEFDISPEELVELKTKYGYEPIIKIGEGHTREAIVSWYTRGEDVKRERVLKRATQNINPDSIQAIIAAEKGGWDHKEVDISNDLNHPNLTKVVDSFEIKGVRYNVEEFEDGEDLETKILSGYRYDNRQIERLFGGILEGALYLHDRGILHRDLKPSNILIVSNDHPKISDLQTAAYMHDVIKVSYPTRGGIAYSHPSLINVLFSDVPTCANHKTEVHSLGGILYFTLTGEKPFDYRIKKDPNGKPLVVGNKTFKIKLYNGEEEIPEITDEIHERELGRRLAKVPRKWRGLVYRCLTTSEKGFRDVSELKRYFDSVNAGFVTKAKESFFTGLKYAPVSLATGGLIGGIVALAIIKGREEPRPTMQEIVGKRDYARFSLEEIAEFDRPYINYLLFPHFENAKKRLEEIEKDIDVDWYKNRTAEFNGVPKRLFTSWLRACYINQEEIKEYNRKSEFNGGNEKRVGPCFVPFMYLSMTKSLHDPTSGIITAGTRYLKQCITPGCQAPDVFARYFSNSIEELNTAMIKSEDSQYLPGARDKGALLKGYQSYLPRHVRNLTNTATALYLITDEDGNIDWSKAPEKSYDDIRKGSMLLDGMSRY